MHTPHHSLCPPPVRQGRMGGDRMSLVGRTSIHQGAAGALLVDGMHLLVVPSLELDRDRVLSRQISPAVDLPKGSLPNLLDNLPPPLQQRALHLLWLLGADLPQPLTRTSQPKFCTLPTVARRTSFPHGKIKSGEAGPIVIFRTCFIISVCVVLCEGGKAHSALALSF